MKTKLGGICALYPMPTTIVGALVDGKPNFITIAHVGIMNHGRPQYVSLGVNKAHHTNQGIRDNKTFSINLPGEDLVVPTDYCGLVSGRRTDKSCVFEVFYGVARTAPLIVPCPVNMECRLERAIDFPTHDIFIGEIVETYCDEAALDQGRVDLAKVKPLLFDMASKKYWGLGQPLADCWSVGKAMKRAGKEA